MAGRNEIKCIGPSMPLADRKASSQRSVNWYMSQVEGLGEDKQVILKYTPGLSAFLTLTGLTIRGSYYAGSRWFVVAGTGLYEVTTTYTLRGTLSSASGYVSMKHGRDQLVIVDALYGYVFNLNANTFSAITDPDWRGSAWVEELDGYFVFVPANSDQFYLSQIDDGSNLDALDFSSADAQPDNIITHRVRKRELYLFGSTSTEIWVDSGGADFPFVRYNSTPIDVGCVSKRSVALAGDSLIWVGRTDRGTGTVYEMQGHQPVRISHQGVEEALAGADLSECSVWSYQTINAEFVGINAPGMDTTWVFDMATRQWHERGELVDGEWTPWTADLITAVGQTHYAAVGDTLYALSGAADTLERTWPHLIAPSLEPVSYRGLQLACTTGGGGTITLEVSNDGGSVFNPPLLRSLGVTGRRMQKVRWMPLGTSEDRVFRLRATGAGEVSIHSAAVDA